MNIVYNCCCMEYMKTIEDNYYELAICDPPYGIERFKSGGSIINKYGDEKRQWNNTKPNKKYFNELFRISKKQIIWGANNFSLPESEYFIIWKKSNALDFSFAMCEQAWTNIKKPAKIFELLHVNIKEIKIHPTQKPVALYKWLLQNYAKEGDQIFDSHVGSGSSRIACYELGFDFVGCELDPDYHKAQEKRFVEFKKKFHNEFYIGEADLFKGVK